MKKTIAFENSDDFFSNLKSQGKKIVFTNGCFDLLHPGHIDYLEKAKKLGDILVIGLNSDESVQRLKGSSRPINNENFRACLLSALSCVDYVVIFSEDTPEKLIKKITPSVLVKGGDYTVEKIVGANYVKENNGSVAIVPFLKGYSSSSIISKIQNLK